MNGAAEVAEDDPLLRGFPGGQVLVRVRPRDVLPDCPRYVPDLAAGALPPCAPRPGSAPPEPGWKSRPALPGAVPPRSA